MSLCLCAFVPLCFAKLLSIMLDATTTSELTRTLRLRAEEKFGKQRAAELQSEVEQMAAELQKLSATLVEIEDEP